MEKKKAFTLIELMGVLVIIGVLSAILIPVINNNIKENKQKMYEEQIELIKLSAKNLASDNQYILPSEELEEIYITLGQLRAMGYAEGTIINPLTKENFPDSMIVMVIKVGNDYEYRVIEGSGETITASGITVGNPSKKYIKKGVTSSYIITGKTVSKITQNEEEKEVEYYINIGKENIVLSGEAKEDSGVKYKIEGNNGLYKLTILGGSKEGYLYFNFDKLKDMEGKEIDITEINNVIENTTNKKILVDNTLPECSWEENTIWTKNNVTITLKGIDNQKISSKEGESGKSWVYSGENEEIKTDELSYEISDEAGNKRVCKSTVNVYHDTISPAITNVNNTSGGNWTKENISVSLSITENGSGLSNIGRYAQGDSTTPWQKNYNWKNNGWTISGNTISGSYSAEQNNTAYFQVCDNAGNCSNETSTPVRIDKTPPVITNVNNSSGGNWTKENISVSLSITENGSGLSNIGRYAQGDSTTPWQKNYNWKNNGWTISGNTISGSYSAEQNNTAYFQVCDNAGNCSNETSTPVKIDKTAPTVSCSWSSPSSTTNSFDINCSINDKYSQNFQFKYAYCYDSKISDASEKSYTCQYKSLDNRYNSAGWRSFAPSLGFQTKLNESIPYMYFKASFRDEAGNETNPQIWTKS